jgi:hypothetical protein
MHIFQDTIIQDQIVNCLYSEAVKEMRTILGQKAIVQEPALN